MVYFFANTKYVNLMHICMSLTNKLLNYSLIMFCFHTTLFLPMNGPSELPWDYD